MLSFEVAKRDLAWMKPPMSSYSSTSSHTNSSESNKEPKLKESSRSRSFSKRIDGESDSVGSGSMDGMFQEQNTNINVNQPIEMAQGIYPSHQPNLRQEYTKVDHSALPQYQFAPSTMQHPQIAPWIGQGFSIQQVQGPAHHGQPVFVQQPFAGLGLQSQSFVANEERHPAFLAVQGQTQMVQTGFARSSATFQESFPSSYQPPSSKVIHGDDMMMRAGLEMNPIQRKQTQPIFIEVPSPAVARALSAKTEQDQAVRSSGMLSFPNSPGYFVATFQTPQQHLTGSSSIFSVDAVTPRKFGQAGFQMAPTVFSTPQATGLTQLQCPATPAGAPNAHSKLFGSSFGSKVSAENESCLEKHIKEKGTHPFLSLFLTLFVGI